MLIYIFFRLTSMRIRSANCRRRSPPSSPSGRTSSSSSTHTGRSAASTSTPPPPSSTSQPPSTWGCRPSWRAPPSPPTTRWWSRRRRRLSSSARCHPLVTRAAARSVTWRTRRRWRCRAPPPSGRPPSASLSSHSASGLSRASPSRHPPMSSPASILTAWWTDGPGWRRPTCWRRCPSPCPCRPRWATSGRRASQRQPAPPSSAITHSRVQTPNQTWSLSKKIREMLICGFLRENKKSTTNYVVI